MRKIERLTSHPVGANIIDVSRKTSEEIRKERIKAWKEATEKAEVLESKSMIAQENGARQSLLSQPTNKAINLAQELDSWLMSEAGRSVMDLLRHYPPGIPIRLATHQPFGLNQWGFWTVHNDQNNQSGPYNLVRYLLLNNYNLPSPGLVIELVESAADVIAQDIISKRFKDP